MERKSYEATKFIATKASMAMMLSIGILLTTLFLSKLDYTTTLYVSIPVIIVCTIETLNKIKASRTEEIFKFEIGNLAGETKKKHELDYLLNGNSKYEEEYYESSMQLYMKIEEATDNYPVEDEETLRRIQHANLIEKIQQIDFIIDDKLEKCIYETESNKLFLTKKMYLNKRATNLVKIIAIRILDVEIKDLEISEKIIEVVYDEIFKQN